MATDTSLVDICGVVAPDVAELTETDRRAPIDTLELAVSVRFCVMDWPGARLTFGLRPVSCRPVETEGVSTALTATFPAAVIVSVTGRLEPGVMVMEPGAR